MKTAINASDLFIIFTFKKKHYLCTDHVALDNQTELINDHVTSKKTFDSETGQWFTDYNQYQRGGGREII